ncbi:VENN motif pre-toxin domain-containing protein, partial [Avibacterium paragallinarum]|nr:VENN motif pre-toxin domain-containing protein [Avibacterium paragallinarum]
HSTVEALAKTLNINTALDEANQQVEKPRDTQSQLQEQKIIRDAVGNLQSAMATYTANQAKPAAEQDSQKLQQKTTALLKARETQTQWSEGNYKRTLDTATTIASGLLAGQSGTQIATSLASPYLNQQIKRFTTDEKGEVNLLTNTIAHAVLGAAEAAAAKGDITAGAISASASELAAPALTRLLGKDNANQLNSDERQTVIALSSPVGALTAGLNAQQTGSGNNTVGILNAAALGGEIGKRAVENNFFGYTPTQLNDMAERAKGKDLADELETEAKQEVIDRGVPHYVVIEGGIYKYSAKLAINTRNGDIIPTLGISPISLPIQHSLGMSIETGWILNLDNKEIGSHLGETITNTLKGYSIGEKACFKGCIGINTTIPDNYSSPKYMLGIGVGYGLSGGMDYGLDEIKLSPGGKNEKN